MAISREQAVEILPETSRAEPIITELMSKSEDSFNAIKLCIEYVSQRDADLIDTRFIHGLLEFDDTLIQDASFCLSVAYEVYDIDTALIKSLIIEKSVNCSNLAEILDTVREAHDYQPFNEQRLRYLFTNGEHILSINDSIKDLKALFLFSPENIGRIIDAKDKSREVLRKIVDDSQAAMLAVQTNQRQSLVEQLGIDTNDERINKLIDPVTLQAIEHPRLIRRDTTGQYFELATLERLSHSEGWFEHPLTREHFSVEQIWDAEGQYKILFDTAIAEMRAKLESSASDNEAGHDNGQPPPTKRPRV